MATTEEYAQKNKYPHSLFIADYAVTHTVSWDDLNTKSLIFGKDYVAGGVGYTLQILAQKGSNPTVISLLLSLESVFATISGAAILGDRLSGREYFGCALMLAAVVLAQLPDRKKA